MIKVNSHTGQEYYKSILKNDTGIEILSDEPIRNGGKGLGLSPKELLCASLASCTGITLRMYANHKQWDLKEVDVRVELKQEESGNLTFLQRHIHLIGELNEEQTARLLAVANNCPVHKILRHTIQVNSEIHSGTN